MGYMSEYWKSGRMQSRVLWHFQYPVPALRTYLAGRLNLVLRTRGIGGITIYYFCNIHMCEGVIVGCFCTFTHGKFTYGNASFALCWVSSHIHLESWLEHMVVFCVKQFNVWTSNLRFCIGEGRANASPRCHKLWRVCLPWEDTRSARPEVQWGRHL